MNPYKLKAIVDFLRQESKQVHAAHHELLRCYGLHELLPVDEQTAVQQELAAIAEAEMFMEHLRLATQRWQ